MLTDISIAVTQKLARVKKNSPTCFRLIITRIDLVKHRFSYLARTRLVDAEKEHLNSLRSDKRRREWLAGRIAAKEAVFKAITGKNGPALPCPDYQSLAIDRDESGRPCIIFEPERKEKLNISISHSHGRAAAMVSSRPCGVDIQKVEPGLERVRKYFVGEEERELLDGLDKSDSLYTPRQKLALLWSAKEALKKQSGSPMPGFLDLELVEVQNGELPVFTFSVPSEKRNGRSFKETAASLYAGYSLAWTISE